MNESKIPNVEPGIPGQGAVSVYGQSDAMDDFPVLKAFQQYIDAEQAKAQKRMTTLCVFFAIILAIVVGVFVALLMSISSSKNDSNDKLIQYMLQERERQHAAMQAPAANPQNDAAFKALTDTVTALQKQLADQQLKMIEEKQKAAEEAVKKAAEAAAAQMKAKEAQPPSLSPEQLALEQKNKAEAEKLAKAKAELAKEKEELRQREIEMHRRRLYPDYYKKLEAEKNAPAKQSAASATESRTYFDEDDDDDFLDLEDEEEISIPAVKPNMTRAPKATPTPLPAKPAVNKPSAPQPEKTKPIQKADGTIRYFDDEEDENADVGAGAASAHDALLSGKGSSSGWTIPLE